MLIQVENKRTINMQYVRRIFIYEYETTESGKKYYVECDMTGGVSKTVKTCSTREEAEKALEQILSQYDRGQRVIKIK